MRHRAPRPGRAAPPPRLTRPPALWYTEVVSRDPSRSARVQTAALVVIAVSIVGVELYFLRPILVPFVLALLLSYCLAPVVDVQMRFLHFPKGLAWVGTAVLAVGVLSLLGLVVAQAISSMTTSIGAYQAQFDRLEAWIIQEAPLGVLGIRPDPETGRIIAIPENAANAFISGVIAELTSIFSNGFTVLIFLIFILLGQKREVRSTTAAGLLEEIENRVKVYVLQMVFISSATGLLVGAVYWMFGVEFALLFGFLTFLLNFIPTIGPLVALGLPIPVILLNPTMSTPAKVFSLVIPSIILFVSGNIIQPKLQGEALDLHPVVVLMALIFWGMIWGPAGLFLATPITAVIKIVCERIPGGRPFADVLAGNLDPLLGMAVSGDTSLPPPGST